MPQPAQHSLIHILLLWITILTITQAVFIALFFTAGHHGLAQKKGTVAPDSSVSSQSYSIRPPSPLENGLRPGQGKMLTFKGIGEKKTVKWEPKNPCKHLFSEQEEGLTVEKDGYYFLNLQITLKTCRDIPSTGDTEGRLEPTVSVIWKNNSPDIVLLQGWIHRNTCSTGLLSRVTELSAGGSLVVFINLTKPHVDDTESLTHLDIIYMPSS